MWTPWATMGRWGRARQEQAVENARTSAVACSRARVERMEIELYVEELNASRARRLATA